LLLSLLLLLHLQPRFVYLDRYLSLLLTNLFIF